MRAIVAAVGGPEAVVEVGYAHLMSESFDQHEFFVVVRPSVKGAIVGKEGANAHRIRELVRTRASVLGSRDPVNVRIIARRSEAPEGVEFRP